LEHVKDDGNPLFIFDRAKGDLTTKTIVGDGTILGSVVAHGYDGVAYRDAAYIRFEVDGAPGVDDMPGKIMLSTSPAGATLPVIRQTIYRDGTFEYNGLMNGIGSETVADDAYIDIPSATSGWGTVFVGDNDEFARFRWTTAGVVTLDENTANVVTTDTDTKLCIFDNGTTVRIRNRLGATKTIKYRFLY